MVPTEKFGDLVNMDFITMESSPGPGRPSRKCLLIYDVATQWLQVFDTKRCDAEHVEAALRRFAGPQLQHAVKNLKYVYHDDAP